MRSICRLAALVLAVAVGAAAADAPRVEVERVGTTPRVESAVALDWTGPGTVRRGQPNDFTLTVTNTGRVAVQRVTVQAKPPTDATVVATDPPAAPTDGVLVWEVGTLQPGESKPLAVTLTAGRRGDFTCPAWVTYTAATGMAVKVQEPKLDISLRAPATVPVGDHFELEAVITNVGDCPLNPLTAVAVPGGAAGPLGYQPKWEQLCRDLKSLAPGQTATLKLPAVAMTGGTFTCELVVTGDGARGSATAAGTVAAPKLTATVTGPETLLVGRRGTYTLTVRNVGELAVEHAASTVRLPAGLRTVSGDGEPVWKLGTLNPGDQQVLTFEATATTIGSQPVIATVVGTRGVLVPAECRTAVDGVPALRVELVDTADPVETGHETTYEIRVTNTGTKADEGVTVACELPAALEFVSANGSTGHTHAEFKSAPGAPPFPPECCVTFDPIRELAPKTEGVFRVKVKATGTGDVRFKAVVTSKHLTAPVVKEESTRVYGD